MKNTLKVFLILIFTTGIFYPVFLTTVAKYIFPKSYEGNLIFKDEVCRGSFSLNQTHLAEANVFVPKDSCSGVDPHLPLDLALLQAPMIAEARHQPLEKIEELITHFVKKKSLGFLGPMTLNTMKVNLELDHLYSRLI